MLREEVLKSWGSCKEVLVELKDFIIAEGLFSTQAKWGKNTQTKLVWIKDPENNLKAINLSELPKLKKLKITHSPEKAPSLTSLTIRNSANYLWGKTDFTCLWTKTKYFSQVKQLTLHYLSEKIFPEKIIDFSAYTSLESLIVEMAHGQYNNYEKIILKAPNLKILDWKGGWNLEKLEGLEQCPRLETVRFKDITVSRELGEVLKKHPRYAWACKNRGEDAWEWVVKME